MDWLNIDNNLVDDYEAGKFDVEIKSEVLKVKIERAFIRRHESGAMSFNLEFKTENDRTIFAQEFIQSGEEKGLKSTYTDKTGQERLLPGLLNIMDMCKVVGVDFKSLKPKDGVIEIAGKKVQIKYFDELMGKTLMIANQAYEDDYNNELKVKTKVVKFMDEKGNDKNGNPVADKYIKKFEKTPVVGLKKKEAVAGEAKTEKIKETLSSW